MNFRSYIEKLRGLSDKQKKIVLWTIVVVLAITMGFFWINGAIKSISKMAGEAGKIQLPQIENSNMDELNNLISGQASTGIADWKTYKNEEYGFEIKYPLSTEIITDNLDDSFWGSTDYEVVFAVPIIIKNDDGSELSVYIGNGKNILDNCLKFNFYQTLSDMAETEGINGITFNKETRQDDAMGGKRANLSQYSVVYNNYCYSIHGVVQWTDVTFIHGATDGKPTAQEEIDEQNKNIEDQKDTIKKIISTFKFIQ